jgi:hypothetical protein
MCSIQDKGTSITLFVNLLISVIASGIVFIILVPSVLVSQHTLSYAADKNYLIKKFLIFLVCFLIQNQTGSINFLYIFFFLNFVEEIIRVFCFPFTSILHVPLTCLHFPIWNIIFHGKRR